MDNAVALSPNANPLPVTFAGRLQAMPLRSKVSAVIGALALAAIVFAMTAWNSHGDYKVLYANLSDKDGGA
jgi:Flagellar biosynthesis/type III secretory pathway lipoprotein